MHSTAERAYLECSTINKMVQLAFQVDEISFLTGLAGTTISVHKNKPMSLFQIGLGINPSAAYVSQCTGPTDLDQLI